MTSKNIFDRLRSRTEGDALVERFWVNLEAYVKGSIQLEQLYESMFDARWLGDPFKYGFYGVADNWRDKRHQLTKKHSPELTEILSNEGLVTRIADPHELAMYALGHGLPETQIWKQRKDLALVDLVMSLLMIRVTSQVREMPVFDSRWFDAKCPYIMDQKLYQAILDSTGQLVECDHYGKATGSGNVPIMREDYIVKPVKFADFDGRKAIVKYDQKNRVHIILKCILKGFMAGFDPQLNRLNDIVRGALIPHRIEDAQYFCAMLQQAGFTDLTPAPDYNKHSSKDWWHVNAWKYVWQSRDSQDPTVEIQIQSLGSYFDAQRRESTMSHDSYAESKWRKILPMIYSPELYWNLTAQKSTN
jgi:hypothetical protein